MLKNRHFQQGAIVFSILLASPAVSAQEACLDIDTMLTADRAQEYATLVSSAVEGAEPNEVGFLFFMETGSWSVANVTTPNSEAGYFFFEDVGGEKQIRDVWGGIASVSERPDLIAWAEALGAPADLATCFAKQAADMDDE